MDCFASLAMTVGCVVNAYMAGAPSRTRPNHDDLGYSTPASSGVNSYTDEQNSQVTTTLLSLTISARSCAAKLFSIAETASREQEHWARSPSCGKTRTPRSWKRR